MSISDDCWLYGHKQGNGQTRTTNTTVKEKILDPTTNQLIDMKGISHTTRVKITTNADHVEPSKASAWL